MVPEFFLTTFCMGSCATFYIAFSSYMLFTYPIEVTLVGSTVMNTDLFERSNRLYHN